MATMKAKISAIRALEDSKGRVTAEKVIAAAKSAKHPLHNEFPWDDKKAAHEHRLNIARKIIASVRVSIVTETRQIKTVAYVRDPAAMPKQGYRAISHIVNERDTARETLTQEVSRIQSLLERAREIADVLDLSEELDAALDAIKVLTTVLRRSGMAVDEELQEAEAPTL